MQEKLNIAVFVDYDNIEIGLKSTLRREFDVSLALDALKERGVDDHFRRLAESGIDHLHASIAQRPGDYLGAAIMSVEAGFCHQHPDSRIHTLRELTGTRRKATQGRGGEFA